MMLEASKSSAPRGQSETCNGESCPVVIASILRESGSTGVHTHTRQVRRYLETCGTPTTLVTPFSWAKGLTYPVFGLRLPLERISRPASVIWYRQWHGAFLYQALRRHLARTGETVVYAQGPEAANAALRARRGPFQRIVMAVHYETSHANEWAAKGHIHPTSSVFRAIRRMESEVIPRVDGLVYVSQKAREEVLGWLPQAGSVPSAVISNFVAPVAATRAEDRIGDLVTVGGLEVAKNHRYLLHVVAEAKRIGRELTLDVYGIGHLRKDLQRLAVSLGIADSVRLRGFDPDVRSRLPGYRAYVHASYVESQSLAIIEAMAAGLPVVAGRIGGIPEICDEGVEARFWPLDNAPGAADTLLDLLDSPAAMASAATAAKARFHRDFDASVVGPKLRTFLLSSAPTPP